MIDKNQMLKMLKADVVPSLGCTEPVCAALAAADASKAVAGRITKIEALVNPNIYKNGMSVGIPGFDLVGLDYAAALGALMKNPEKSLELMGDVTAEIAGTAKALVESGRVKVSILPEKQSLYVNCTVTTDCGTATTTICDSHTNIVKTEVNGEVIFEKDSQAKAGDNQLIEELKTMKISEIRAVVDEMSEEELLFMLDGVEMNNRISAFAQETEPGVGITRVLKKTIGSGNGLIGEDLMSRITLKIASAAEGRLDGCPYPSMSSAGAGTKGLVVIIPIAEAAKAVGASGEQTVKALAFGHMLNRYINAYVGKLAATCTCSMASATAASAAMTWLFGGGDEEIGFAVRNMAGTVTGMICDGGKTGCALKVSMAANAALTSAILAADGASLRPTDGICAVTPEDCIINMGRIGNPGMIRTDKEILDIMLEK